MKRWSWLLLLAAWPVCAEDHSQEIEARIRRWQQNLPQYADSPNVRPAVIAASETEVFAQDRTGASLDPLAAEFLMRGYYLLDALRTKRDMAPLTEKEILAFQRALRLSRIEFVDHELFDDTGKRVVAVTDADPKAPRFKLIQVYRQDWNDSARLGADLTQFVFHEYLRAIEKYDDHYVISKDLTISEKDYRKRSQGTADCLSGKAKVTQISLNLALDSVYTASTAYVNGQAIGGSTNFRVGRTAALCTSRAYKFKVTIGDYTKTLHLYGGDEMTLLVPSDREYYRP